jgi:hypothetical protein
VTLIETALIMFVWPEIPVMGSIETILKAHGASFARV